MDRGRAESLELVMKGRHDRTMRPRFEGFAEERCVRNCVVHAIGDVDETLEPNMRDRPMFPLRATDYVVRHGPGGIGGRVTHVVSSA